METIKSPTKSTRKKTAVVGSGDKPNGADRFARIAVSAYYKAQARGFEPGYELDDWLAAEAEEKQ
ncbi:DUF2934 domain-containing protein [Nitrosomonas communis]|uniref:DUF2934 domain-containing protein n=1 Tax=Nitrosomonas communis TaxID=44574 RepID=UPI0026EB6CD8|nr:DUF2934 domain-containing protein [Nitrosomonas communis]MCO6427421.1 DUF2934 domain-containing protein [Nitrosomonas communis]